MADEQFKGMHVDPARDLGEHKKGGTVKVIAVADSVGYTDINGYAQYKTRGEKFDLPKAELERLTALDVRGGLYPAVVKPDHPHLPFLRKGVQAADDPGEAMMRLRMAHGEPGVTFDPAGDDANRLREGADPGDVKGPWNIPAEGGLGLDVSVLDAKALRKLAKANDIDVPDGTPKDDLVALFNARADATAGGGVTDRTPRMGEQPGEPGVSGRDTSGNQPGAENPDE